MVQRGALEALLVRREEATRMIEGFLKIVIIRDLKVLDFVAREVSQLCLCVLGQLMDTPRPRSIFLSHPKSNLGLQQNFTLSGMWGPKERGHTS